MKSKKRHHASSDDSEDSNISDKSSSSSDSDSDDSSDSDHRYKKKRKHADLSDSDSHSDDQKRSKKRKHKKKKKKHSKKKRRSESVISADHFSLSDEGVPHKKKKKHKHKSKRSRSASLSEEEDQMPRRLHSVVKERRPSSGDGSQPSRTYYQKEYRRSASVEHYDREQEVQRFYRGSSKEHKYQRDDYGYDKQRNERVPHHADKYDRNREKYNQIGRYDNSNPEHGYRQKNYDEYKRARYEDRRPDDPYNKRPREDTYYREDHRVPAYLADHFGSARHVSDRTEVLHHHLATARYDVMMKVLGNDRFNQYDNQKRREYNDGRDYRDRRAPPEPSRYRDREFVDKREKPREERFSPDRSRDMRRERPSRPEKPSISHQRESSKSPEERLLSRERRGGPLEDREERGERIPREERRPSVPSEGKPRERKSRFADVDDNKEYSWGKADVKKDGSKGAGDKEKPNFGLSGKLTADANTVNGVVIKYREPDDAKQPKRRWRFYPFKGDKALPILYIHRQSCFLLGRDKNVADIPLEHPSVSKQHAVLQYRATPFTRPDGSQGRRVRPYIIDLESANGTFVNNKKIEPRRYVELLERDVVKFGFSQREYVLLHENSKDDAQDDDNEPAAAAAVAVTTTDQIKIDKRIKEEIAEDGD